MIKRKTEKYTAAILWCLGIFLAGSDSSIMPWPNFLGMVLFGISGMIMTGRITLGKSKKSRESGNRKINGKNQLCYGIK